MPGGERKYMGALLVGVHENGKLKFAGRVGTGFSVALHMNRPLALAIREEEAQRGRHPPQIYS
jgi:ATP-dependent DNA ligase